VPTKAKAWVTYKCAHAHTKRRKHQNIIVVD